VAITILGRSVVDELHFSDHTAAPPVALTVAKDDPAPITAAKGHPTTSEKEPQ